MTEKEAVALLKPFTVPPYVAPDSDSLREAVAAILETNRLWEQRNSSLIKDIGEKQNANIEQGRQITELKNRIVALSAEKEEWKTQAVCAPLAGV